MMRSQIYKNLVIATCAVVSCSMVAKAQSQSAFSPPEILFVAQDEAEQPSEKRWIKKGSFSQWRKQGHEQRKLGYLSRAEYSFKKALVLAVAADNKKQQTLISLELGSVYYAVQATDNAARFFSKAIELAHLASDRMNRIKAQFNLALLERQQGNLEQAEMLLADAGNSLTGQDEPLVRAKIKFNHGRVLREMKQNSLALGTLKNVARISDAQGFPDISAAANAEIAAIERASGNLGTAGQRFGKSLKLFEEIEDKDAIANVYSQLGNVHLRRREYDLAKDMFRRALDINKEAGNTLEQARQHMLLAKLFGKLGDNSKVCKNIEGAKSLFKTVAKNKIWGDIKESIAKYSCQEDTGVAWAKAQMRR